MGLGHPSGSPEPEIVNLPPAVEIAEGALAVIAPLTTKRYPFVSPMGSTLTLTLYWPLSTSGRVKVMDVAEAAEGVTLVSLPVFLLVRTTMGEPRSRLLPVRVTVPVVIIL